MDSTCLYFMRSRYYNPIAQRFISPDPKGRGSMLGLVKASVFSG